MFTTEVQKTLRSHDKQVNLSTNEEIVKGNLNIGFKHSSIVDMGTNTPCLEATREPGRGRGDGVKKMIAGNFELTL